MNVSGLWRRIFAFIVDGLLLSLICIGLAIFFKHIEMNSDLSAYLLLFVMMGYFIFLQSSSMLGTIGKRIFGLKVVNSSGERISFMKSVKRLLGLYIFITPFFYTIFKYSPNQLPTIYFLVIVFILGWYICNFIYVAVSVKHQALHDLLAETFVVKK